jgi:hypothetical protein
MGHSYLHGAHRFAGESDSPSDEVYQKDFGGLLYGNANMYL